MSQQKVTIYIDFNVVKNHFLAGVVESPSEIITAANQKKSFYVTNIRKILPAAVIQNMQFRQVINMIENNQLVKLSKKIK